MTLCVAQLMACLFEVQCVLTAASACWTVLGSVPGFTEVKEGTQGLDVVHSTAMTSLQEVLHPLNTTGSQDRQSHVIS